MSKAFVLGSINLDYVIETSRLPQPGETILGKNFLKNPGGKGANQAIAISNQEEETYLIGMVGNDSDSFNLVKNLVERNVYTEFVRKSKNNHAGIAIITLLKGNNSIIISGGANLDICISQVDEALAFSERGDYFITQFEIELDIVKYGLKKAKSRGLITVVNPSPKKDNIKDMYPYIDYLILNETECESLTKLLPSSNENITDITNYFSSLGVKNTIITKGSDGVSYYKDNKVINIPAKIVKVVDTTAAGDTFIGVFVSRLMKGHNLKKSVEFANKAASLTVTKKGAQNSIPFLSEITEN